MNTTVIVDRNLDYTTQVNQNMRSLKAYIPAKKKTAILVEGREVIDDIDFTFQALEGLLVESQELRSCSFAESVISKSTFNSVVLEGCWLLDSNWKSSSFLNTLFYWTYGFLAIFEECIFKNVTFSGCNFEEAIFKNCQFINVKFAKDNLGGSCDISGANFTSCKFSNVTFNDVEMDVKTKIDFKEKIQFISEA